MKHFLLFISLILSPASFASEDCSKIVDGYQDKDTIFVLCSDLMKFNDAEAANIVKSIFSQYVGPPDEVLIYFVAMPELVGATRINGPGITGLYYTHDNILEINPNSGNKRSVKVEQF